MNPTTTTEAGAVADVAAKLTQAQRVIVLFIGEEVKSASDIDAADGKWLFDNGYISQIHAAGYGFTNLTEFGRAVGQHLEQGATAGVVGGKEA